MVIKPIRDKNTHKVLTNVEVCKRMYKELNSLLNPNVDLPQTEREALQSRAYKICGGSQNATEVLDWLKQINDAPDDVTAQRLIENTLLPVQFN